jgi:hypothetical protein
VAEAPFPNSERAESLPVDNSVENCQSVSAFRPQCLWGLPGKSDQRRIVKQLGAPAALET